MDVQMPLHERVRDGAADSHASRVRAHADHLRHRRTPGTRARSPTPTRAARSTSSSRRSCPRSCARRCRSSSTCSCKSVALEQSLREVTQIGDRFRDSEAHTRSVLANVADGIVTVGDDGHDRVVQQGRQPALRLRRGGRDRPVVRGDGRADRRGGRRRRRDRPHRPGARRRTAQRPAVGRGCARTARRFRSSSSSPTSASARGTSRSAACATSPSASRTPRRSSTRRCTTR